ncbi:MAG: hypothetical protein H6739_03820 [Alphaproteobacteria bacterium]|nr:hypothetical protein [Alphaproteobacteria bacterium]
MKRRTKWILGGIGGLMLACAGWCLGVPCFLGWFRWGIWLDTCPDGVPRALVDVDTWGLERGREGSVNVYARAAYLHGDYGYRGETELRWFDASLEIEVNGERRPLDCDWDDAGVGRLYCPLTLPEDIPDGDHTLWVKVDTPLDEDPEVAVPLPLYVPALVHVLTDRPLYQPGDDMMFRSLTLSRGKLEPIDERPGLWTVTDPTGEVLLEERSKGGPWGVAASSFPLAPDAPSGAWQITWRSGDDSATASVTVEPFTLPRYTVEAQAEEPWYGVGDRPAVAGVVAYTSGAPVADAVVDVEIRQTGDWPPPTAWTEPIRLRTDNRGRFRVALPEVPGDLVDTGRLRAAITVTDATGDRVSGGAGVLLSRDPLAVDAVTELGDGLVADFNNRVYLRITSPDGRALSDAPVTLRNRWDSRDQGHEYTTDADGVVAFQVDPGQPVNVEVPAQPVRPPKRAAMQPVTFQSATALLSNRAANIAERTSLQRVARGADACGLLVESDRTIELALVIRGGRVAETLPQTTSAERCLGERLAGELVGTGGEEVLSTSWSVRRPEDAPTLRAIHTGDAGATPNRLRSQLEDALRLGNRCISELRNRGEMPQQIVWSTRTASREVSVRWADNPAGIAGAGAMSCVQSAFPTLTLPEPAPGDAIGVMRVHVDVPTALVPAQPGPTVTRAFEFEVAADGVGETTWRVTPGAIPAIRLRPSKVLLTPGEPFEVELLRGPDFKGDLPIGLSLQQGDTQRQWCPRTPDDLKEYDDDYFSKDCPAPVDDRAVKFKPAPALDGFMSVEWGGARAVVYVRPASELSVEVSTDRPAYAPGAEARLTVQTSSPAVVSLSGVDETLSQLVPLPGPGVLGEVTVTAKSDTPAFGMFDALALATGRIRGENAAMAAVQRVSVLDTTSPHAAPVSRSGYHTFDPDEELASAFYEVLGDVHLAVREWESSAPEGELLTNPEMAELWTGVLDAREAAGAPVTDAYQRRLDLWELPDDLLALTEPRILVRDGTRVPEDIDPWMRWVREEMER